MKITRGVLSSARTALRPFEALAKLLHMLRHTQKYIDHTFSFAQHPPSDIGNTHAEVIGKRRTVDLTLQLSGAD